MSLPQISLIIPIYNAEKYLAQTLESLIKQTFTHFEVIGIDDGSSDQSVQIFQQYAQKDPRFTLIQQKNQYAGIARNQGLKKARGKYICFLDSDDWLAKNNALQKMFDRIESSAADVVIFKAKVFDEKQNKITKSHKYDLANPFNYDYIDKTVNILEIKKFAFSIPVVPWNKIYRRDFLIKEKIVFQNLKNKNDVAFAIETIVKALKIAFLDEALVIHRVNAFDSLSSHQTSNKNWENILLAWDEAARRIKNLSYFSEFKNYYLAQRIGSTLYWYQITSPDQQKAFFQKMKPFFRQAAKEFDFVTFGQGSLSARSVAQYLRQTYLAVANSSSYDEYQKKIKQAQFWFQVRQHVLRPIYNLRSKLSGLVRRK